MLANDGDIIFGERRVSSIVDSEAESDAKSRQIIAKMNRKNRK